MSDLLLFTIVCVILLLILVGAICLIIYNEMNYDKVLAKSRVKAAKKKASFDLKKLRKDRPTTF